MPVPLRFAVWVCELPLSVMVRVPVLSPVAVGVKVTVIVQDAPAGTGLLHVPASAAKSPVVEELLTYKTAAPVFVTVMFCAELVVPTS
jgi:hypothetical protein